MKNDSRIIRTKTAEPSRPKHYEIVPYPSAAAAKKFLTEDGWIAKDLKDEYKITFSRVKNTIRIAASDNSEANLIQRAKAADVLKAIVVRQKENKPVTEKFLHALMHGESNVVAIPKTEKIEMAPQNKIRSDEVILDRYKPEAVDELFREENKPFVQGVQSIFDVKILHDKGATIAVRPSGKLKRRKADKEQDALLVGQAIEVLGELLNKAASHEILSKELVAKLALEKTADQSNQDKTMSRVSRYLGEDATKKLLSESPEEQQHYPKAAQSLKAIPKSIVIPITDKDFGPEFKDNMFIRGLFSNKLGMDVDYNSRNQEISLTKKPNTKIPLQTGVDVITHVFEKYVEGGSVTVDHKYVENAVDNVLNKRRIDYIEDDKKASLDASARREAYKLHTFNKVGENKIIYPRTESQYELYDAFYGKPSRDMAKSYREKGKKIIFGIGEAATGKTAYATFLAVQAFKLGVVDRLVFCRPMIAAGGQKQGALPGGIKEKTAPYLMPIYENLKKVMPDEEAAKFIVEASAPDASKAAVRRMNDGREIEICQLELLRGRTIENGIIIGDELQNATDEQVRMFLSRLGKNSRAFVSFDLKQIDLKPRRETGAAPGIIAFHRAIKRGAAKDIAMIACNGNLRDEVVSQVHNAYATLDNHDDPVNEKKRIYTMEDHYVQSLILRPDLATAEDRSRYNLSAKHVLEFGQNKSALQVDPQMMEMIMQFGVLLQMAQQNGWSNGHKANGSASGPVVH